MRRLVVGDFVVALFLQPSGGVRIQSGHPRVALTLSHVTATPFLASSNSAHGELLLFLAFFQGLLF